MGKRPPRTGLHAHRRGFAHKPFLCLLCVSRNFLYGRKSLPHDEFSRENAIFTSLVDTARLRLRQHRPKGNRRGYAPVDDLPQYGCGCVEPCFLSVPVTRLPSEYIAFFKLAQQLRPRRKENRYLLSAIFCSLTNASVRICNSALSALYTISESVIADLRRVLNAMCSDPSLQDLPLLEKGVQGYRKNLNHPVNRYPNHLLE